MAWISHGEETFDLEPNRAMNHKVRHTPWDLLLVSEKITRDTATAHFVFRIINCWLPEIMPVPGSQVLVWEGMS